MCSAERERESANYLSTEHFVVSIQITWGLNFILFYFLFLCLCYLWYHIKRKQIPFVVLAICASFLIWIHLEIKIYFIYFFLSCVVFGKILDVLSSCVFVFILWSCVAIISISFGWCYFHNILRNIHLHSTHTQNFVCQVWNAPP